MYEKGVLLVKIIFVRLRDPGAEIDSVEVAKCLYGRGSESRAYRKVGSRSPGAVTGGAEDTGLVDVAAANQALSSELARCVDSMPSGDGGI